MGWAKANLVYDKYDGIPPDGSPLETVMLLVWVERQQASLLATRALVQASVSKEDSKDAIKAFEEYCKRMFPFYENATKVDYEEEKKALAELVKHPVRIDLAKVYAGQARELQQRAAPRLVKKRTP